MITSSTSERIASVMARKSSTSYDGVPSGRRAWMWIITPPSSTIRRASAPYSSGVYGMAGHCSRPATAPEIAHVMMTGSSRLTSDGLGEVEDAVGVDRRLDGFQAREVRPVVGGAPV